jgi:hypothetical protein
MAFAAKAQDQRRTSGGHMSDRDFEYHLQVLLDADPEQVEVAFRVLAHLAPQQERNEWDRAELWLEHFAPSLERIAAKRAVAFNRVRKFAQKRVRGKYADARRAVMEDVDELILKHPLWGDWCNITNGLRDGAATLAVTDDAR